MEEKVISILKDRTISISKIILKNYKKLNISDTELIIMMVLSFSLYWIELSDIMLSHLIQNVYILNIAILRIFHLDY